MEVYNVNTNKRSHLNCVVEDTEPFGCPNTHIPSIGLQGKKDTRHLRLFCLLNVKRGSYVQVIPRCLQYNMELGLYESKERKATCLGIRKYNGQYRSLPNYFTFKQSVCIGKKRASQDTGLSLSTRVFPTDYYSQVILCHTRIVNSY